MRVLVIGGTRFIGVAAVRRLHALGHEVTVFHRGQTEAELPTGVHHLHGDRKRLRDHQAQLASARPDVVLDMLPYSEDDALNLMTVLGGLTRRVVAISSQDVYRAWGRVLRTEPLPDVGALPEPTPLTENSPLRERLYPYRGNDPQARGEDYDKILVERVVLSSRYPSGTVLRLPLVYGPLDPLHRFHSYLERMDAGRPAILLEAGYADWRWTAGYVEDVAEAIALAVTDDRAAGKVFNVGERETPTFAERVRALGRLVGWTGEVAAAPCDLLPDYLLFRGDTRQPMVADTTRIRSELGFAETVTPDEALQRTVEWERSSPPPPDERDRYDYAAEDAVLRRLRERGAA